MAKSKIKPKTGNYDKIRSSNRVRADLERRAKAIASSASTTFGGVFEGDVRYIAHTCIGMAKAVDSEAMESVSKQNALEKSLFAGGG